MVAARGYVQSRPLGDVTVTAINDGSIALPVELTVPEEVWRQDIDVDPEGKMPLDTHVLLVQTAASTILIDAGLDEPGSSGEQRFLEEWPGSRRTPGVVAGLASVGIKPEDVTQVLLTHVHFDHVVGLAAERDGRLVPRYPNAHVVLGRADWENPPEGHLGPEQRARIGAVAEAGLLALLDGEREIVPGVTMIPAWRITRPLDNSDLIQPRDAVRGRRPLSLRRRGRAHGLDGPVGRPEADGGLTPQAARRRGLDRRPGRVQPRGLPAVGAHRAERGPRISLAARINERPMPQGFADDPLRWGGRGVSVIR